MGVASLVRLLLPFTASFRLQFMLITSSYILAQSLPNLVLVSADYQLLPAYYLLWFGFLLIASC